MTGELGTTVTLTGAFDDAVSRVTAALKADAGI